MTFKICAPFYQQTYENKLIIECKKRSFKLQAEGRKKKEDRQKKDIEEKRKQIERRT